MKRTIVALSVLSAVAAPAIAASVKTAPASVTEAQHSVQIAAENYNHWKDVYNKAPASERGYVADKLAEATNSYQTAVIVEKVAIKDWLTPHLDIAPTQVAAAPTAKPTLVAPVATPAAVPSKLIPQAPILPAQLEAKAPTTVTHSAPSVLTRDPSAPVIPTAIKVNVPNPTLPKQPVYAPIATPVATPNSKAPNAPVINVPVAPSHLIAQATPIAPKAPAVPSAQPQTPVAPAIPSHLVGSEVNVNIPHPAIKAVSGEDGSLATAQVFSPNVVEKEHVESAPAYIAPSAPAYKAPVATPAAVPSKLAQTPVAPVITPVLAPVATPTAQHYKEPQNVAVPTVIAPQAAPESKAVPVAGHYKEPQNVAIPAQPAPYAVPEATVIVKDTRQQIEAAPVGVVREEHVVATATATGGLKNSNLSSTSSANPSTSDIVSDLNKLNQDKLDKADFTAALQTTANGIGQSIGNVGTQVGAQATAAQNTANTALSTAQQAQTTANTVQQTVQQSNFVTKTDFDAGQKKQDDALTNESTRAKQVEGALQKDINGRISTAAFDLDQKRQDDDQKVQDKAIADNARDINQNRLNIDKKVDQTTYDANKTLIDANIKHIGDVNTQQTTDIASNKVAIGTKVGQADVDKSVKVETDRATAAEKGLDGRVTKTESGITQLAGEVAQKVSTSDFKADQTRQDTALNNEVTRAKAAETAVDNKVMAVKGDVVKAQSTADGAQKSADVNKAAIAKKVDQSKYDSEQAAQDKEINDRVKTSVFTADQQRQDKALASGLSQKVDTTTFTQRSAVVDGKIASHETRITSNTKQLANHEQRITKLEQNGQRISKNERDIKEVRKQVKAVGAMASASANLHYNRAENGYAVAVGEYDGSTAIAGGLQFNTSANTAVTVQASYDGEAAGASVGFHGSW